MKLRRFYLRVVILLLTLSYIALARYALSSLPECTIVEAQAADSEAPYLSSWEATYESYRRYKNCDDGSIAEGYSVTVSRLLTQQWTDLPKLASVGGRDKAFVEWLLRHIDETLSADELADIASKAQHHCPEGLRTLCDRILAATKL